MSLTSVVVVGRDEGAARWNRCHFVRPCCVEPRRDGNGESGGEREQNNLSLITLGGGGG